MKRQQKQVPGGTSPHDGVHPRGFEPLKNGKTLLLEGAWLLEQFEEGLVGMSMRQLKLSSELRARITYNMKDDTWLALKGKDELSDDWKKKDSLVYGMMRSRIPILEATYWKFYHRTAALGWNESVARKIADTIIPFIDIGERTCYTYYGHNYRTMIYAEMLVDSIGLKDPEKAEIVLGALAHDIGKAGVPGEILRKNGKPDPAEAKLIKLHTNYGRDILNGAARVCAARGSGIRKQMGTIADIAFSHQEKFCGEGYPRGKVGQDIAFGARVVAFCDALDAMTSKRLYQQNRPKTFAQAKAIALAEMDLHFNRNIVSNFFSAVEKGAGIREIVYAMIRNCGGNPE